MINTHNIQRDEMGLIPPYGGVLKQLILKDKDQIKDLLSKVDFEHECSERNACDVELLMIGAFSPLEGFMNEEDYKSVIKDHKNTEGFLFGLPIVLDTSNNNFEKGKKILLKFKGQNLAILEIESKWEPDKELEAQYCYGTTSLEPVSYTHLTLPTILLV